MAFRGWLELRATRAVRREEPQPDERKVWGGTKEMGPLPFSRDSGVCVSRLSERRQQSLNFLPLPHGHTPFRDTFCAMTHPSQSRTESASSMPDHPSVRQGGQEKRSNRTISPCSVFAVSISSRGRVPFASQRQVGCCWCRGWCCWCSLCCNQVSYSAASDDSPEAERCTGPGHVACFLLLLACRVCSLQTRPGR